jgi:23S rRNA pseudouridine1911/1915/1917 synthase
MAENCKVNIVNEEYRVPEQVCPVRLSDFAAGIFRGISSRKGMKKAIDKGWVKVDGKVAGTGFWIRGGETIVLSRPDTAKKPVIDFPLQVLFEDEFLAVVYKPGGIAVSGNKRRTLENALPGNLKRSEAPDAIYRPEPVHRLDFPTSGALLVAKTQSVLSALNQMFANREIKKEYRAIVPGGLLAQGEVRIEVNGRRAHTSWKILRSVDSPRFGKLHLVQLIPHTGRRHQLRQHMAALGCPILGDIQYAGENQTIKGKGLFLHAFRLEFRHPATGEMVKFEVAPPAKFNFINPV